MKVALGRILCDEAALSESYYHVAHRASSGYRALCDRALRGENQRALAGMWAAEVGIEEAARRLREIGAMACSRCRTELDDLRDPITRLGEVGEARSPA